jgi:hypothetical protein
MVQGIPSEADGRLADQEIRRFSFGTRWLIIVFTRVNHFAHF